jgi:RNA polymerase sigma factor (sigma-70 family)
LNAAEVEQNQQQSRNEELAEDQESKTRKIAHIVDYVYHPLFKSPLAEEKLFGEGSEVEVPNWTHFPEVPEDIQNGMFKQTILTADDEAKLFLKYNYARYRFSKLLTAKKRIRSEDKAVQIGVWYDRAIKARAGLAMSNMALVLAIAKRTRRLNVDFSELVSEGNIALLRSIDKFDVARGFKFSTYAYPTILRSFCRLATTISHYRQHFSAEFDPELERSDLDVRKHDAQWTKLVDAVGDIMANNQAQLSDLERTVIVERFAIITRGKGRTLAEVGRLVGLTNERVRRTQNTALRKIRAVLELDEKRLAA